MRLDIKKKLTVVIKSRRLYIAGHEVTRFISKRRHAARTQSDADKTTIKSVGSVTVANNGDATTETLS